MAVFTAEWGLYPLQEGEDREWQNVEWNQWQAAETVDRTALQPCPTFLSARIQQQEVSQAAAVSICCGHYFISLHAVCLSGMRCSRRVCQPIAERLLPYRTGTKKWLQWPNGMSTASTPWARICVSLMRNWHLNRWWWFYLDILCIFHKFQLIFFFCFWHCYALCYQCFWNLFTRLYSAFRTGLQNTASVYLLFLVYLNVFSNASFLKS